MKPLLTATALALSIAAVSSNALAATVTLSGVKDEFGNFAFYDPMFNNGSDSFATLTSNGSTFRFATNVDYENSSIHSSTYNPRIELADWFVFYSGFYEDRYSYYLQFDGGDTYTQVLYADHTGYLSVKRESTTGDGYYSSEDYQYNPLFEPHYWHYWQQVSGAGISDAPFDVDELASTVWANYPTSGYDFFDFQNSFVYYSDGTFLSFSDILGEGGFSSFTDPLFYFYFAYGNIEIEWSAAIPGRTRGLKTIDSVTLAINTIPEPETWAMLLAGLGIVSAVARRRRIKAAM